VRHVDLLAHSNSHFWFIFFLEGASWRPATICRERWRRR
jgi:hypothetical protein